MPVAAIIQMISTLRTHPSFVFIVPLASGKAAALTSLADAALSRELRCVKLLALARAEMIFTAGFHADVTRCEKAERAYAMTCSREVEPVKGST